MNKSFEDFDKEYFGNKDTPIDYATIEVPLLGTRYVDNFVQQRYDYWLAAKKQHNLTVEVSHMKETNGNQWWSVMLLKEGGKIWDGYQVYSSKIKGRADYEADELRYFLGLSDKKPFILDYDTDGDK